MDTLSQLQDDFQELPKEAQEMLIDFIAFLKQKYKNSPSPLPLAFNLENQPFVGMWSERKEMEDSSDWVKKVRQQHWGS